MEDLNGWMTISQAARYKGCTGKAIRMRILRGTMPHRRLGNTMLVRKTDLDAWQLNETMQEAQKNNWRQKKELAQRLAPGEPSQREIMEAIERTNGLPAEELRFDERSIVATAADRRRSPFD